MRYALIAVLGETRKGLLIGWTYRANLLISLFTLGFIFVGIAFFVGGGSLQNDRMASFLLGYLTWMYAALTVDDLSGGLSAEMSAGTLEQMAMSPAPLGMILLGRVLAKLVVTTVQVLILGTLAFLLLRVHLPLRWEAVPVLLLTLFGVSGFGFIVAGATLVLKQVASFASLMNNALAFMNGSFLPVEAMPGWLSAVARTLPSTQGIVVLRRVVLEGQPLTAAWQDRSLVWLVVHSTFYFALGWVVFLCCERAAKEQGTLSQY